MERTTATCPTRGWAEVFCRPGRAAWVAFAIFGAGIHQVSAETLNSAQSLSIKPAPALSPPPTAIVKRTNDGKAAQELSKLRVSRAVQRQTELAMRALKEKRYEDALRNFAVAYAFSPTAEALLKIAESAHKAERYAEALVLYQRLLAEYPQLPSRQDAEGLLTTLRGILVDEEVDIPQMVRDHLEQAKRSFQNQKYEAAIYSYSTAYALKRLPRLLFNVAQAERRFRNMVEAYLMYERLVQEEPGTPVRSEAESYLAELRVIVTKPPIQKQPWFWGATAGGAAAVAVAIGLGVGLSQRSQQTAGTLQLTFPLLTLQR